jgi:uncharacterized protein YlxW (UPF0749 family)
MGLHEAENYARRLRNPRDAAALADDTRRALNELIKEIKDLQARVSKLERPKLER